MRSFSMWMSEYGVSHQNKTNIIIHKFCVPLIMWSVIGILWTIPTPEFMSSLHINFATLLVIGAMIFYLSLSLKYFLFMIPLVGGMYYLAYVIDQTGYLLVTSIIVFIISWVFQFIGHKIEGKKPSFIQDLAFLLIGPLWVTKAVFRLDD